MSESRMSWPAIILNAVLRPSAFIAFLDQGWWAIRRAALVALFVQAATASLVWLLVSEGPWINTRGIRPALILTTTMFVLVVIAGMALSSCSDRIGKTPGVAVVFWILREQIAFALPLFMMGIAAFTFRPPSGLVLLTIWFCFMTMWSMGLAGVLTNGLVWFNGWQKFVTLRWIVVFVALVAATELWRLIQFFEDPNTLLALITILTGLGLGMLRLLSWLWESIWSLLLVYGARRGIPLRSIRSLHPVSFDELSLLPLPGLSHLLASACQADEALAIRWLLEVEHHAGQRGAVRHALRRIEHNTPLAHSVLLKLSLSAEGTALLQRIGRESNCPVLVRVYAALCAVSEPEAWLTSLRLVLRMLREQPEGPGRHEVPMILELSYAILQATDWRKATRLAQRLPDLPAVPTDRLRDYLLLIEADLSFDPADPLAELATLPAQLQEQIRESDDWIGRLLATLHEHLMFLHMIEQQRKQPVSYDV